VKIAQVATVGYPVHPARAGSIELVVWNLTEQLIALGHEVTVFATADSQTSGRLVAVLEAGYNSSPNPPICDWLGSEWMNLCAAAERAGDFDLLHSHAYIYGVPLAQVVDRPMVHTHHVGVSADNHEFVRRHPGSHVTAISAHQWSAYPGVRLLATIPHGLAPDAYVFHSVPRDYLCFLGRFIPGKGPVNAVEVARKLDIPLIFAGERTPYFTEAVEPLVDGDFIRYVGPVYGEAKSALLGGARALVYPLASPEPFGLVMVEAMLCGTPVAAIECGAVPEIVDAGVTGVYAKTLGELIERVPDALGLDRAAIRRRAERRFSARRMALDYLDAYQRIA